MTGHKVRSGFFFLTCTLGVTLLAGGKTWGAPGNSPTSGAGASEGVPSPLLQSTYLGGDEDDLAWDLAIHPSGDIIVVGEMATDLFLDGPGNSDGFVMRLDAGGTELISSMTLGGSGIDRITTVAIDDEGIVHVAGGTASEDFPTTSGAFDPSPNGGMDAFYARLDMDPAVPPEDRVLYATCIGGEAEDGCADLELGPGDAVTLVGFAGGVDETSTFPTTDGAFQTQYAGGDYDAFVTLLRPDASLPAAEQLVYSTFVGGTNNDAIGNEFGRFLNRDGAVDEDGTVTFVGRVNSTDFPITAGAFQESRAGAQEVHVTRLKPDGTLPPGEQLRYSTYLGSSNNDAPLGVVLDDSGGILVAGWSASVAADPFPTTPGAFQRVPDSGEGDAFLARIVPNVRLAPAEQLTYSTLVGGSEFELFFDLDHDPSTGHVVLGGYTFSEDYPTTPGAFQSERKGSIDVNLTVIAPDSTLPPAEQFVYSTLLGGETNTQRAFDFDDLIGLVVGDDQSVLFTGTTDACDFPTTPGALSTECTGEITGFLSRFDLRFSIASLDVEPRSGVAPLPVRLDGSGSTPAAGTTITAYTWDLGEGDVQQDAVVEHTYETPGRYPVSLLLTNDAGLSNGQSVDVIATCPSGDVAPWAAAEIGAPAYPGNARLEGPGDSQALAICAGGRQLTEDRDEFSLVYQDLTGAGSITVRVRDVVHASSGDQVGVMLRGSLDEDAPFAAVLFESSVVGGARSHSVAFRSRRTSSASLGNSLDVEASTGWMRVERRGETVQGFTSQDGVSWTLVSERRIPELPETLLAGLVAVGDDAGPGVTYLAVQAHFSGLEDAVAQIPSFQRGDSNTDGDVDVSDAISVLTFLFLDSEEVPPCEQAADANDSGLLDLADPVFLLDHLFTRQQPIPAPFDECGFDTTLDTLSCESVRACGAGAP